jgi:hypothetical protein
MLGLVYFLFVFAILVMISVVTKIIFFVIVPSPGGSIKQPITNYDKLFFAISFSYFMTYIKFF